MCLTPVLDILYRYPAMLHATMMLSSDDMRRLSASCLIKIALHDKRQCKADSTCSSATRYRSPSVSEVQSSLTPSALTSVC